MQEAKKKASTISQAREKVDTTNKAYAKGRDIMGIEASGAAKKGQAEIGTGKNTGLKRDIFLGREGQKLTDSKDLEKDFLNRINEHVKNLGLTGQDEKDYKDFLINKIKSSNADNIKSKYDNLVADMKTSNNDEVAKWGRMIENGEKTLADAENQGIISSGGLTSAYRNLHNLAENYDAFNLALNNENPDKYKITDIQNNLGGTPIGIEVGNVKSSFSDYETIVKAIKDPNVLSETNLAIMEGGEAAITKRNDNIKGWGWKVDPNAGTNSGSSSSSQSMTNNSSNSTSNAQTNTGGSIQSPNNSSNASSSVVYSNAEQPSITVNAPEVNLGSMPTQQVNVNTNVQSSGDNSSNGNDSSNYENNDNNKDNGNSNNAPDMREVVNEIKRNSQEVTQAINSAKSEITDATRNVSDAVNNTEVRQRSRQEELLDAMGGHGMRSEEEIRNEDK